MPFFLAADENDVGSGNLQIKKGTSNVLAPYGKPKVYDINFYRAKASIEMANGHKILALRHSRRKDSVEKLTLTDFVQSIIKDAKDGLRPILKLKINDTLVANGSSMSFGFAYFQLSFYAWVGPDLTAFIKAHGSWIGPFGFNDFEENGIDLSVLDELYVFSRCGGGNDQCVILAGVHPETGAPYLYYNTSLPGAPIKVYW